MRSDQNCTPEEMTDSDNIITPPVFSPISSCSSSSSITNAEGHVSHPIAPSTLQLVSFFKLVGDNLDKSIQPRHETMEHHSKSLHYFHMFAVKDRCNTFDLADNPALCDTSNCDVTTVLPTIDDDKIFHVKCPCSHGKCPCCSDHKEKV